jgi:hypothetical protein
MGTHGNTADVRHRTSTLIDARSVPRARQARSGAGGRQSRIGEAPLSAPFQLLCRIVGAVLCVSSAHTSRHRHPVWFSRDVPSLRLRPSKPYANGKRPRSSKRQTPDVPGSRGHSLRAFVLSRDGEHAPEEWTQSMCRIS